MIFSNSALILVCRGKSGMSKDTKVDLRIKLIYGFVETRTLFICNPIRSAFSWNNQHAKNTHFR